MSVETVNNLSTSTVKMLRELIQINEDSVKGFASASESIDDTNVKGLFSEIAGQRERFAEELRPYVRTNDGDDQPNGSIAGAAHRTWLKVRDAISSRDLYAVLAEAERGEDHIKHKYEEALKETAGSAVNDVLLRQYTVVKSGHDRVRDTRDAVKETTNA